jgi:hypothetical protein
MSGKGAKGTMSDKKGDKKKPTSRSVKAGLQFPVGRIHRFLKVMYTRIMTIQPSFLFGKKNSFIRNKFDRWLNFQIFL